MGCATSQPQVSQATEPPQIPDYLNQPRADVLPIAQVTQLSEQAQTDFLAFYNAPKFANTPKHERLAIYLSLIMDQFEYAEKTYSANETLEFKSGNCLSLSLLTTAYAQLAGINIEYQLLERNPIYAMRSNFLVESEHIRAVLIADAPSVTAGEFSFTHRITIDFFDSSGYFFRDHLSIDDQVSLYYSNRAVELMIENRLQESFAYLAKALALSAKNLSAINSVAVLLNRHGDAHSAERFYQYGLRTERRLTFLKNYLQMLDSAGRLEEARGLKQEYLVELRRSPGYWISEATRAEEGGDLQAAIVAYEKAVVLAPDIHQLHFWMSQLNLQLGYPQRSQQNLSDAIAVADSSRQRKKYQGKGALWAKKNHLRK